jgi:hypothetical protein
MDMDIARLFEFAFAATSAGALACKRQTDVQHRPRIDGSAQSRRSIGEISRVRLVLTSFAGSTPKNLIICAIVLAMTVGGCARNRTLPGADMVRQETGAGAVRAPASTVRYSARPTPSRIRRVARALLVPPAAPDCEFKESDPKTMDADQWDRLKLEYERQCYKNAEQAVRKRLKLLQAANRCEVAPGKREFILRNWPH